MIRQWKRSVPLVLAGGLAACSSTVPVHHTRLDSLTLPPGGTQEIVHPQLLEESQPLIQRTAPPHGAAIDQSVHHRSVTQEQATLQEAIPDFVQPEIKPQPRKQPQLKQQHKKEIPHYTMMGDGRLLLGQTEWIWLPGIDLPLKANMATDQQLSSIYAAEVHYFKRNGQQWVTFHLLPKKPQAAMSLPVNYWIKEKADRSVERIPVIISWIEIGEVKEPVEFKLYHEQRVSPVTIGRNFLKDNAVVDQGRRYVQPKPEIPETEQ
ncbi:hypothetical protein VA7868_03235 [Vibrio aerogenes CECT 7868]|uniref:Retropepsin-like aspartic endopeptidase domain-containing protein n=1 Tax=Vibrio aerogenes CECT 7868 TaxID=1216006 RepID=A0A1M5ZUI6_9VIBR|nr:RimK/LysX family protein [Vibrio aerogenes]SHI27786.1 hypothetical protein VA7868_03235 [Vibrio aerogenes CECT 7868]